MAAAYLIVGQDMVKRQLYEANRSYVTKHRFRAIIRENKCENEKWLQHFYSVGDHVMTRVATKYRGTTKKCEVTAWPYEITKVHDYGIVTLEYGVI